jgi:hypothetical protein
MARWVDIVTPAALNSKRASMRSIPVEWLAWFAELTLAVGPPTACKAGLTLSLGVKILQWLLYLIRQVSTPICVMASEILPCRLSASSTRHYSRAQRVIQRFQTRVFWRYLLNGLLIPKAKCLTRLSGVAWRWRVSHLPLHVAWMGKLQVSGLPGKDAV